MTAEVVDLWLHRLARETAIREQARREADTRWLREHTKGRSLTVATSATGPR